MLGYGTFNDSPSRSTSMVLVIASLLASSASALADTAALPPQTKVRISIVQWMPTKGAYEKWDALGGEFLVSPSETLTLPVIGTLSVANLDSRALAANIAMRLKTKIGLTETPEATVEIINYPPFYVVGDVAAPGEYKFQTGLTVLQALAIGGGERRVTNGSETALGTTELVGQLREMDNAILRNEIRISRLRAEMIGDRQFSIKLAPQQDKALADGIFKQEQALFKARANVLSRQAKSFSELRVLLGAEIDATEKKILGNDADIASVEKELAAMKSLVERGIALPTRQSDLERTLRSYHADRLDMVTAIMRARQNISEATRNLDGLYDRQLTDVAGDLQMQQAALDQMRLKRETAQRLLLDALSKSDPTLEQPSGSALSYTVIRQSGNTVGHMPADETTLLQPGDVIRVVRSAIAIDTLATKAADGLPQEESQ